MRLPLLFSALLVPLTVVAEPKNFSSGPSRTHLIELYTSEGCSSCPPAEQWLGSLRDDPGLWRDFVPVAFHVVYWDRLGWRDRFASRAFTDREYRYAADWGSNTVYTPCFVLNGADQRNHAGRNALRASTETAGVLAANYAPNGALSVTFSSAARGDYEVHAAVLGGGIISPVRAGENSGRTLHHEFIALVLKSEPLRNGTAEILLPAPETAGVTRHALAVWVTRHGEQAPVQATGGWLD